MDAMLTFMLSGVTMTCVRAMSTAGRRVRAPVAKRIPHEVFFGQREEITELCPNSELMSPVRSKIDYYYWLRDDKRKNEGVLEYLQEENEYTKAGLKHVKPLQEELYKQMLSNMKETDENLPYRRDNYFYYSRTVKGMAYAIHCRKEAVSVEQSVLDVAGLPEEVILDENKVAEGLAYCVVDECEPSPSHEKLAYSTDTTGYETYDIMIKVLQPSHPCYPSKLGISHHHSSRLTNLNAHCDVCICIQRRTLPRGKSSTPSRRPLGVSSGLPTTRPSFTSRWMRNIGPSSCGCTP